MLSGTETFRFPDSEKTKTYDTLRKADELLFLRKDWSRRIATMAEQAYVGIE